MKHKVQTKLRSRTGASISFGLLIFLVCAVLCSVILVSATTAAGRMSKIAETDQRYYAVTSAAELLKDLISGKTVTIEKVTEGTRTEVYIEGELVPSSSGTNYDVEPKKIHIKPSDPDSSSTIDDEHPNPTFSTIPADAAYKYYKNKNGESDPKTKYTLALEASGDLGTALNVSIVETVDLNGNITFTVGNADSYQVELVFSASVNGPTVSEAATGESATSVTSETNYTIETKMEKTETTTLTWTLTGIKTIS